MEKLDDRELFINGKKDSEESLFSPICRKAGGSPAFKTAGIIKGDAG